MKKFIKSNKAIIFCLVSLFLLINFSYLLTWISNRNAVSKISKIKTVENIPAEISGVYIISNNEEDVNSIVAIFDSCGFPVIKGDFEKYKNFNGSNLLVVISDEEANLLSKANMDFLISNIQAGQKLITWGKSDLLHNLNINIKLETSKIDNYVWSSHPDCPINLKNKTVTNVVKKDSNLTILASSNNESIAVSKSLGKGSIIYTGFPIAFKDEQCYENFPFLMEAIKNNLKITPSFCRNNLALYMDISVHVRDNEDPSILADKIKSWGVNQINLSAWYKEDKCISYTKSFIDECHKRGISVYAWTEFPMAGIDFWNKYPQWREITASGKEAFVDWRHLMSLQNPQCMNAIKDDLYTTIKDFDWDGIDLAEIYFETPSGISSPDNFTPMDDSFRKYFKTKYKVDPIEIFDSSSKYYWKKNKQMYDNLINTRIELINKYHDELLSVCEDIKKIKPYLQTSVTIIDTISAKDMRENIGVDANSIIKLQDKYPFMLQIEDPYTLWTLGPERYKLIGEEYKKLMNPSSLLSIDINIVKRGDNIYPTSKQRGIELLQLIHNASKFTDKVIMYSVHTMEKDDMTFVPYAQAQDISVSTDSNGEFIFKASKKFSWQMPIKNKKIYINGKEWPYFNENSVIIPSGTNLVTYSNESNNKLHITDINSEIISSSYSNNAINIEYSSIGRCYITLSSKPSYIELDGEKISVEGLKYKNSFTLSLPAKEHNVLIK